MSCDMACCAMEWHIMYNIIGCDLNDMDYVMMWCGTMCRDTGDK